jgi:multiple sugar transport system substrate-binding protein
MWAEDPIMTPFKTATSTGRMMGYAGPPDRRAAEVISKYIITDMYAKAVQGMKPEEAVKSADGELRKIYGQA